MKILHLTFSNLNSLQGKWSIDFTNEAYTKSGLFAITGPTGSGKTTILDALCLALYGNTPRISNYSAYGKRAQSGLFCAISSGTDSAFAEVIFEGKDGRRYKCRWHGTLNPERNGLKQSERILCFEDPGNSAPAANLRKSVRSRQDPGWTQIDCPKRELDRKVISLTGMSFEEFTQAMLLAQGQFAKFLNSDINERANLLQNLTQTDIYKKIQDEAQKRASQASQNFEKVKAVCDEQMKDLVSEEEVQEWEKSYGALKQQIKELDAGQEQLQKSAHWLEGISNLQKQINAKNLELNDAKTAIAAFAPRKTQLELALKAQPLNGQVQALNQQEKEQSDAQGTLAGKEQEYPVLEEKVSKAKADLDKSETLQTQLSKEKEAKQEVFAKLEQNSQFLQQKQNELKTAKQEYDDCCNSLKECENNLNKARSEKNIAEQRHQDAKSYLDNHAEDKNLAGMLSLVENLLNQLQGLDLKTAEEQDFLTQKSEAADKARRALEKAEAEDAKLALKVREQGAKLQSEASGSGLHLPLSGEALSDLAELQTAFGRLNAWLNARSSLEEQRHLLKDGCACPLCGALEHPYAKNSLPAPSQTQELAENFQKALSKLGKNRNTLKDEQNKHTIAQSALEVARQQQQQIKEDKDRLTAKITAELEPLGLDPKEQLTHPDELLNQLKTRSKSWDEQQKHLQQAAKDAELSELAIRNAEEQKSRLQENYGKREQNHRKAEDALRQIQNQRDQLLKEHGITDPEAEKARLEKELQEAGEAVKQAQKGLNDQQGKLKTLEGQMSGLREQIAARAPRLQEMTESLTRDLRARGFASREALNAAMLESTQIEKLQTEDQALTTQLNNCQAALGQLNLQMKQEQDKKLTTQTDLQAVTREIKQNGEQLEKLRQDSTELHTKIEMQKKGQQDLADSQKQLDEAKKQRDRWDDFYKLVGKRGMTLMRFAQGLTLERVISFANRRLRQLRSRFMLSRDLHDLKKDPGLNLLVQDTYMDNEVRTASSLSGGETFITSLALALGLSDLLSRHATLKNLFIDEGFGTLDDQALNNALQTLNLVSGDPERLGSGRLIGIISHVERVSEQVSPHIELRRANTGFSTIEGPGCKRL